MKTLTALFTAAALTLTAGLAQADVRVDQIPQLVKEGKIKSLESMNEEALKLHPGATITDTDLDNHFDGYEYEVELKTADGKEYDVDFDATTGKVLSNKQDT
ncbi:PepSY domain-containing protein [Pseudomonas fluorescens]|uniref:PepSY domain-containing protein n=1 Tax=Pseudomonas fluorescens TaxID=294 RepID=A0A944DHX9_PSEFL|nr:PepSY domain-containing protein [Pseudomonas fluorescens]MBT2296326.1 PepSY domain-containing protein [Pseudomonas fluorescens]MBT2308663.1 PepSY domain-containing protein [Pseudomonas fluorescens]MBT2312652.1 PepSY domain-containing protein [Pseudomonas fluorescens]MBT2317781.1 PepSY domain-containing protein [Pseudomonas fluorescens]MBT2328023.1 PepSY domain-containing protein [Pseudomonas fluorescens]